MTSASVVCNELNSFLLVTGEQHKEGSRLVCQLARRELRSADRTYVRRLSCPKRVVGLNREEVLSLYHTLVYRRPEDLRKVQRGELLLFGFDDCKSELNSLH